MSNMTNFLEEHREKDTAAWFKFTLGYLLVDYGRPQDVLPALGAIRPALILNLVLVYFLVKNRAMIVRGCRQLRVIGYFIALLATLIPFARNNYYAYSTFVEMLKFVPFILSIIVCVNSLTRLRTFLKFYVGVMVYVALYAITHNGMGSGNYFGDENDVSLYINMVLPFCYFMLLAERPIVIRVYYGAALVIGLVAVVVSFSRGGFVGLVAILFVVWLVSPRKLLTVALTSLLALGVFLYSGEHYLKEMSTVSDTKESTASARLKSWASAWDMFVDNPMGVGGGNFQVRFPEYQADRFSRGMWGRVAHSIWFTLIPELGIVGIVLFARLLFYNFRDIWRLRPIPSRIDADAPFFKSLSAAFLASSAGFFASASFLSVLYYPHYWYLTAMIVASCRVRSAYSHPSSGPAVVPSGRRSPVAIAKRSPQRFRKSHGNTICLPGPQARSL